MSVGKVSVAGVAARLPESEDVFQFWDNLMSGVDMVTTAPRRWPNGYQGLPARMGTLSSLDRFDNTYFNVCRRLCLFLFGLIACDFHMPLAVSVPLRSLWTGVGKTISHDGCTVAVVVGGFSRGRVRRRPQPIGGRSRVSCVLLWVFATRRVMVSWCVFCYSYGH